VNDANYLDSTTVQGVIDASYIQSNQITYNTSDFLDSTTVESVVDAAYVQARQITYNTSDFLDSTTVESVVDTSYVQARQITYNTSDFTDSAGVSTLISAQVGSTIQAYDANLTSFVSTFTLPTSDGSTGQILSTNGAGTLSFSELPPSTDSAVVITLISQYSVDSAAVINLIDSDYIQDRQYASFNLYYEDSSLAGYQKVSFTTSTSYNGEVILVPSTTYVDSFGAESTVNLPMLSTGLDSAQVLTLLGTTYVSASDTDLTTTSANQIVHTFDKTEFRTMKYVAQIEHGSDSKYHSEEILLTHNGTSAAITSYAQVYLDSNLGEFSADISAGDVRLKFSPVYTNTSVKLRIINVNA
jgi:hypothetical protein